MGHISTPGYNAIIYCSYTVILVTGLLLAWKYARKNNFLSNNGTQGGLTLAVNFIASGMFIDSQGNRTFLCNGQRVRLLFS